MFERSTEKILPASHDQMIGFAILLTLSLAMISMEYLEPDTSKLAFCTAYLEKRKVFTSNLEWYHRESKVYVKKLAVGTF